jgi:hypothetical protein
VPRAFPGIDVVALTPTARVVYFRTRQDSDLDLFSIPDVGGEAALLGTTQSSVGNVALLSDDRLVFVRDGTLSAVSLDGTDGSVLVSTPGWKQIEQIFPDDRILFESVVGAQDTDLFVVTPDGADLWPIGQTSDCEAFALLAP